MSSPYALILAGGAGTRFWPASRRLRPKQFLPLGHDPTEPLLVATARRIAPLCAPGHLLVATGEHLRAATAAALPALCPEDLLCEPVARNTAPCIGWASHAIARRDPNAVVMVFPADHVVRDLQPFHDAVDEALGLAREGSITTIGINPSRPETGYGYIEIGEPLGGRSYRVRSFVEKPDAARAAAYVAGGKHAWNGGMFFFRVDVLNAAIATCLPALAAGLDAIDRAAAEGREQDALGAIFPTLPAVSIDHGVLEHTPGLSVVRADFGWSDVGSWETAWELAAHDEAGNAAPANAVLVDARRNLVRDLRTGAGPPRVVALLGVDDLVMIETDDALLVMPRSRAQDVRAVVDELSRRRGSLT